MKSSSTKLVGCCAIVCCLGGVAVRADVIQPVNLQMKETDQGSVLVQWKVPIQVPIQATPRPVLPDHCVSKGDQEMVDQPGGRLYTETFRCEGGLGGEVVGIRYPFYNATLSTLARIELESGRAICSCPGAR